MAEPTNHPDRDGPTGGASTGRPRWQKVVGIIGLLVLLGLVVLLFASGGEHGPGRHAPGGDPPGIDAPEGEAPPDGHTPPEGGHAPPEGAHG